MMHDQSNTVRAKRHDQYYFRDGSVILRSEDTLYCLYGEMLRRKSDLFHTMLPDHPVQGDLVGIMDETGRARPRDGSCDDYPIPLSTFHTAGEFNELLSFIFDEWTPVPRTLESLVAILKTASFYLIQNAREYAIDQLSTYKSFPAPLRFHLARRYRVLAWISPAVRQLFALPYRDMSDEDMELIGLGPLSGLMRARERIETHRKSVAAGPPAPRHDVACKDQEACTRAWNHAWWGTFNKPGVAKALLHPTKPVPGYDLIEKLEDFNAVGMHPDCRRWTLSWLCIPPASRRFSLEETIIDNFIDQYTTILQNAM
ncbi:hypothetical protein GLOTRDRAFT_112765 [Gloeophyllum trabeum ATCC 11539]|uniref:BTB domain-containing protein n=1 Tax=Gloeophyllum trabeum (strain ATCC 11539 / FP-39264 / Madison 617) TaxID=670483 RepID=S7R6T3_GLOTA|nr:uncharacterized protein GLOTRDRAFT_112765 [Gloeophyllum trabeum ATCC 11539]EPQ50095.1 hypothetical protein GLOTRDRAFT_112765 [Gloeophyllum trabeum ATCC 11539]